MLYGSHSCELAVKVGRRDVLRLLSRGVTIVSQKFPQIRSLRVMSPLADHSTASSKESENGTDGSFSVL